MPIVALSELRVVPSFYVQPGSAPTTPKHQALGGTLPQVPPPGIVIPQLPGSGTSGFGPIVPSAAVNPPPVILAPSKQLLSLSE